MTEQYIYKPRNKFFREHDAALFELSYDNIDRVNFWEDLHAEYNKITNEDEVWDNFRDAIEEETKAFYEPDTFCQFKAYECGLIPFTYTIQTPAWRRYQLLYATSNAALDAYQALVDGTIDIKKCELFDEAGAITEKSKRRFIDVTGDDKLVEKVIETLKKQRG